MLGSDPWSGEPGSATAIPTSWERSARPAACTAEPIIPDPAEPTVAVALGRLLSPASNTTSPTAIPSASAATWVVIVSEPVPNSTAAICTTALPSACSRARARCSGMKNAIGYAAAAIPVPISQSPSRQARGVGSRRPQPKRCAASVRHSDRPSLDHL